MTTYHIGELSKVLGLSADTLRYYEKIGLLPRIARTSSGLRMYIKEDVTRLRFIRRAQKMNFSLVEIRELLTLRDNPKRARVHVRKLAQSKLDQIDSHLSELNMLHEELQSLVNRCQKSKTSCPILEGIEQESG